MDNAADTEEVLLREVTDRAFDWHAALHELEKAHKKAESEK